jgi:hypothetical protein
MGCTICTKMPLKIRNEIDEKLIEGIAASEIAREYFPDKPQKSAENIIGKHKNNGHIRKRIEKAGIETERQLILTLTEKVENIYERAMRLSAKAEEMAVTSRDFADSAKCMDNAVKSIMAVTGKNDKEITGIGALEEYLKEQNQRAKELNIEVTQEKV